MSDSDLEENVDRSRDGTMSPLALPPRSTPVDFYKTYHASFANIDTGSRRDPSPDTLGGDKKVT